RCIRHRRLAASRFADESIRLAAVDGESHPANRLAVAPPDAVAEPQVGHLQRGRLGRVHAHRSSTCERPSANRLTAITMLAIASAGKRTGHQRLLIRNVYCSAMVRPQSGLGGGIPNPRNDRVAIANTA